MFTQRSAVTFERMIDEFTITLNVVNVCKMFMNVMVQSKFPLHAQHEKNTHTERIDVDSKRITAK